MRKQLISIAAAALLTTAGFAQSATTTTSSTTSASTGAPDKPLTINQRKRDQQARIRQGVRSDELTRGETRHLENQEHDINKEERNMRKLDNGKLTAQDRKTLNQQQNQESKRIYKDKHNNRKRG